jgi:hypothetical protein
MVVGSPVLVGIYSAATVGTAVLTGSRWARLPVPTTPMSARPIRWRGLRPVSPSASPVTDTSLAEINPRPPMLEAALP